MTSWLPPREQPPPRAPDEAGSQESDRGGLHHRSAIDRPSLGKESTDGARRASCAGSMLDDSQDRCPHSLIEQRAQAIWIGQVRSETIEESSLHLPFVRQALQAGHVAA